MVNTREAVPLRNCFLLMLKFFPKMNSLVFEIHSPQVSSSPGVCFFVLDLVKPDQSLAYFFELFFTRFVDDMSRDIFFEKNGLFFHFITFLPVEEPMILVVKNSCFLNQVNNFTSLLAPLNPPSSKMVSRNNPDPCSVDN